MGFGIAISTSADLGTSPIGSLPYVLSFILPLSFGTATFLVNAGFIVFQKILLKDNFKTRECLQIAVILFFNISVDVGMYLASFFKQHTCMGQGVMAIGGCFLLFIGIALKTKANAIYIPAEGAVNALVQKYHLNFGKIKVFFDYFQCFLATLLSFAFLHTLKGIREGTLISAIIVGPMVTLFHRILTQSHRVPHKRPAPHLRQG